MPTSISTADLYAAFAQYEARGSSAIYEDWASGVASDPPVCELLDGLPRGKRQPNLLFAAARLCGAPLRDYSVFRPWLRDTWDCVRPVILSRSTQTNEPGRCAVLLPFFAELTGPLGLIEVGAAAGLCLCPDRYAYEYVTDHGVRHVDPTAGSTVMLRCGLSGAEAPGCLPDVVWRAGIDLHPLNVFASDDVAWLDALIWPEHDARRERLSAAVHIARTDPPRIVAGDLLSEVEELIAQVPPGVRPVVFHTAVLAYMEAEERGSFADLMLSRPDVTWISNEGSSVLPTISSQIGAVDRGRFVVGVDGQARALADPHGRNVEVLATV